MLTRNIALEQCGVLAGLSRAELGWLEARTAFREVRRRELVYFPGQADRSAFLLVRGQVRLKDITRDGRESILAFIQEGELFGELALLDSEHRSEFAEAEIDSRIAVIPSQALMGLVERCPTLALNLAKLVGLRRRRVENRLRNLLFRSNRERLAHILLELVGTHGRRQGSEWHLTIGLSHQDLANLIGITRESVTLTLGQLQAENLVRRRRRTIVILDPDRLSHETNGGGTPQQAEGALVAAGRR